jgi:chromosome condensin MukBEF ATPase and DNA-binding subunit MukB
MDLPWSVTPKAANVASIAWPEVIVSVLGAGGLTQLGNILSRRDKSRQYAQGAVDRAMQSVAGQLERTDKRLTEMEAQHAKCEAELTEFKHRLGVSEEDCAELRRYIVTIRPDDPLPGYVAINRMQEPK